MIITQWNNVAAGDGDKDMQSGMPEGKRGGEWSVFARS